MYEIADIGAAVKEAAADYDIEKVYLFGSHARGTAHAGSDVDLCLETGPTFSLFNAGAFSKRLEDALGASIDVVTERSLYGFACASCLADRVLLYERV